MKMVKRTYNPPDSIAKGTFEITEEQAEKLDKLAERKIFSAYFWAGYVEKLNNGDITDDNRKIVRVNGEHYVIGKEINDSFFRGHAGHKFKILFTNGPHKGQYVESTNVWHQGEIPEELKDILIDNAIFQ